MPDVFISKSTKDDRLALSICDVLEKNGIDCWISNRDLHTQMGGLYPVDIVKAILESKCLLVILTKNSNISQHVQNEVSTACDHQKQVFVLQTEAEIAPNPVFDYYLSQGQHVIDTSVAQNGNYKDIAIPILNYLHMSEYIKAESFIDEEFLRKSNYKQLKKETIQKRQSFIMSITDGDEIEYDKVHFYEQIIRLDVVDNKNNDWSSYRFLTVRNDSQNYTNHIVHKECGEDKAHFKDMRIRAFQDGISGERLSVESLTTIQPNSQQVFRINFKSPLKPGDKTTIFYRLDWPNEPSSYYKEELSQSISLTRYKLGVDSISFGVFEPYHIISAHMKEVTSRNEIYDSKIPCEFLSVLEEPLLKPLHKKTYFGIKFYIKNPSSILYQILYKIEKTNEDEEDEDFF